MQQHTLEHTEFRPWAYMNMVEVARYYLDNPWYQSRYNITIKRNQKSRLFFSEGDRVHVLSIVKRRR